MDQLIAPEYFSRASAQELDEPDEIATALADEAPAVVGGVTSGGLIGGGTPALCALNSGALVHHTHPCRALTRTVVPFSFLRWV